LLTPSSTTNGEYQNEHPNIPVISYRYSLQIQGKEKALISVASDDRFDEAEIHSHKEGLQVEIKFQTRKTIEQNPWNVTNLGGIVFLLTI
jgi:hypothetical protein